MAAGSSSISKAFVNLLIIAMILSGAANTIGLKNKYISLQITKHDRRTLNQWSIQRFCASFHASHNNVFRGVSLLYIIHICQTINSI